MKLHRLAFALLLFEATQHPAVAQRDPGASSPPPQAYADCTGKKAGDLVQHITPEGPVRASCKETALGLAAQPMVAREKSVEGRLETVPPLRYSIEQATSDQAQLHTIAFAALAFLTGDFAQDTFLPPGKVSDYFGFQYMRDQDIRGGGHNTSYLTRIAYNILNILNAEQRASLVELGLTQDADIRRFAMRRFPLMAAFRRSLQNPSQGAEQLSRAAVIAYSASLYELDGELAYRRAVGMAQVLRSMTSAQKTRMATLKFTDSATWPSIAEPFDRRQMSHEVNIAVMTYASEMFSWQAGSLEADAYFCPERHGMYFGGFGMKTAPAVGKPNQSISTSLTADAGASFLAALTPSQRQQITQLLEVQRTDLQAIVQVRREIAQELRKLLDGGTANHAKVLHLSRRYGELDGALSHLYATAFVKVGQSLSPQQRQQLLTLRHTDVNAPRGPFLYSTPIDRAPIDGVDQFFRR